MYAAAYITTAGILGVAGDKVAGVSPLWSILIGLAAGTVPVGVAAWFGRKKNDADVADRITEAAGRLVTMQEAEAIKLTARVVAAELRSSAAEAAAHVSLESERQCRERLSVLEAKVDALVPVTGATTTTTKTVVTHP